MHEEKERFSENTPREGLRHALKLRGVLLLAFTAGLAGLLWPSFMGLYELTRSSLFSHIPLIPLASAYLAFIAIKDGKRAPVQWSPGASLPFFLGGVIVCGLGMSLADGMIRQDHLALMTFGALLLWVGGVTLIWGWQVVRMLAFPLAFLIFTVPLPTPLQNGLVTFLQKGSTEAAHVMFWASGVPYLRDGITFALPGLAVEVAPQCSGIRSGLVLLIMSILAGHFFFRTWPRKVMLVAASLAVSIVKNGARIVTISLLSVYVDPGFLSGPLHTAGGMPFFVLALVMMIPMVWILRRGEKKRFTAEPPGTATGGLS